MHATMKQCHFWSPESNLEVVLYIVHVLFCLTQENATHILEINCLGSSSAQISAKTRIAELKCRGRIVTQSRGGGAEVSHRGLCKTMRTKMILFITAKQSGHGGNQNYSRLDLVL